MCVVVVCFFSVWLGVCFGGLVGGTSAPSIGINGNPIYGAASKTIVGRSAGEIFAYETAGIFQSAAEIASSPTHSCTDYSKRDTIEWSVVFVLLFCHEFSYFHVFLLGYLQVIHVPCDIHLLSIYSLA